MKIARIINMLAILAVATSCLANTPAANQPQQNTQAKPAAAAQGRVAAPATSNKAAGPIIPVKPMAPAPANQTYNYPNSTPGDWYLNH